MQDVIDALTERYGDAEIPEDVMTHVFNTGELPPDGETVASPATGVQEGDEDAQPDGDDGDVEGVSASPQNQDSGAEPPQQKLLAKDGVHEIPFSVLEEERERTKQLEAQLAEFQANSGVSAKDGGVKSFFDGLDPEELEDFKVDYPELSRRLEGLKVEADKVAADEQAVAATTAFDKAVADFNPAWVQIKDDPEFYKWFDSQPAHIRAIEQSGSPEAVASVATLYEQSMAGTSAIGGDTPTASNASIVANAKKNAVSSRVGSLSDIPGASDPSDEITAIENEHNAAAVLNRMDGWSAEKIDAYLDRLI